MNRKSRKWSPERGGASMKTVTTVTEIQMRDRTPPPVNLSLSSSYTDEQFYADLKKAGKQLDQMAAEALKEHAEGKTRKFPCDCPHKHGDNCAFGGFCPVDPDNA